MKPISLYCASAMAALLLLGVNNCTNASAKSDTSVTNSKVVSDGGQMETGVKWSEEDFQTSTSADGEVTILGLKEGVDKRVDMKIPERIGGNVVTEIDQNAFNGVRLSGSVQIPETVQSIGDFSFSNNQISSLDLPLNGKLTSIGNTAFSNNHLSGELVIPNKLKLSLIAHSDLINSVQLRSALTVSLNLLVTWHFMATIYQANLLFLTN
ncbi:leucine-rich repeat protein [Lentilactobacillus rapi]|uniref:Uncharacterized protein n=2 Tax=Lentilactobacillus rapi TaxID=481723 RepID=A0A512PNC8_9LACO|nr:leucine-rich repeat domain-containing protein [Lentilactobacillus rapi]GEP72705.1 hypothetical protein LRA02_15730 [Lentilactobacillus rapi]